MDCRKMIGMPVFTGFVLLFVSSGLSADVLERLVRKHFDLTPRGIDDELDLRRPIYRPTSYHGHFGRENEGFPWEETDKAEAISRDR